MFSLKTETHLRRILREAQFRFLFTRNQSFFSPDKNPAWFGPVTSLNIVQQQCHWWGVGVRVAEADREVALVA